MTLLVASGFGQSEELGGEEEAEEARDEVADCRDVERGVGLEVLLYVGNRSPSQLFSRIVFKW